MYKSHRKHKYTGRDHFKACSLRVVTEGEASYVLDMVNLKPTDLDRSVSLIVGRTHVLLNAGYRASM